MMLMSNISSTKNDKRFNISNKNFVSESTYMRYKGIGNTRAETAAGQ